MKQLLLASAMLPALLCSAQETNQWLFGYGVSLDFNSGSPVVTNNSGMRAVEGTACISDQNGQLLFYTDGDTVWNRNHQPMPNGTGLGHYWTYSTTQAALIVPYPGSGELYYIFCADAADNHGNAGLRYSLVDMSLNSGLGDLIVKSDTLYTPASEKLTATLHADGQSIWVISHNSAGNSFLAYLVDTNGINQVPVTSVVGFTLSWSSGVVGQMKASPDGTKIGMVCLTNYPNFGLFQFDKSTGIVSNPIATYLMAATEAYGLEFSPNSEQVYVSQNYYAPLNILQFDLSVWDSTAIFSSQNVIGTAGSRGCQMQLAPDGKIYVAHCFGVNTPADTVLGVINYPNVSGSGCNYVDQALPVAPAKVTFGLPAFISSYFNNPSLGTNPIAETKTNISLLPNPCTDYVFVRSKERQHIRIYNMKGQLVFEQSLSENETVSTSAWPPGIYAWYTESKQGLESGRLLKY